MEDVSLEAGYDTCALHNNTLEAYCTDCRKLVCHQCSCCKEHSTLTCSAFLEKNKIKISKLNDITAIKEQAKRAIVRIECLGQEAVTDYESNKIKYLRYKDLLKKPECILKDIDLVEKMQVYIDEIEGRASTNILKVLCQEARSIFRRDIAMYNIKDVKSELKNMKKKIRIQKDKVDSLTVQFNQLQYMVRCIETGSYKDNVTFKIFLLLMIEQEEIICEYCLNSTIDEFRALRAPWNIFDIEKVMKQELKDIGDGIMISTPVDVVEKLRITGNFFRASLSHIGTLAIYSFNDAEDANYIYERGDKMNIIQFTDLFGNRQVEMEVESWTTVGFYDDKALFITYDKPLRQMEIQRVFKTPYIEYLSLLNRTNATCSADVASIHDTKILYFVSMKCDLYEYNLITHIQRRVEVGRRVNTIVPLTGINLGIKVVFQDYDNRHIYTIKDDDTMDIITSEEQECWAKSLLPSSSDPKNLAKAAIKYTSFLTYNGDIIDFHSPLSFEPNNSIVRIMKDIFLLYNWNTNSWVISRIIIP